MRSLLADLRGAFKSITASRRFAALAILTLGSGIGLSVTALTVENAYLVRALPYPAADRLHRIDFGRPGQPQPDFRALAALDWSAMTGIIETPISWDLDVFYLLGSGSADGASSVGQSYSESASGAWITPGYIEGLGIRAATGRVFDARDYAAESGAVALISHRLWQSRFQGDPGIVGRTFNAYVSDRPEEAETFTIVGVLAADLWHVNAYTEILAPLRARSYPYMARLASGVTPGVAAERLAAFVRAGVDSLPDDWRPHVTPLQESYTTGVRPMLVAGTACAVLVLVIAGANVAVLLLVRGRRQQQDLAIRLALGATRGHLARQLVAEGLLLGTAATLVGIASSRLAIAGLASSLEMFLARRVPGGIDIALAIDQTVLLGAAACGLGVTVLFTLVPLVSLLRSAPGAALHARGATDTRRAGRTRSVLIGIEVAASVTLLVGAWLMAGSLRQMLRVDFGAEIERVVHASLGLRQRSYPDAAAQAAFYEEVSRRLEGTAGAGGAAIGNWWPLQQTTPRAIGTTSSDDPAAEASVVGVTGGFFATLGTPVLDGRTFDARDTATSEPVIMVSASLARRLWPAGGAIGQLARLEGEDSGASAVRRVIGVVGDVRQAHADPSQLDAYLPLAQAPGRFASIYLRDATGPSLAADLRAAVAAVDPEAAVGAPRPLGAGLDDERARPRFLSVVLGVYAALASTLALVGMHGVIAYAARQRQREIAIRLAIGATTGAVTRLFVRQGAAVLASGIAVGLAGALGLGRLLQSYLYGVEPAEPAIVATAAALFGLVGLGAIWLPARRAASMNPTVALKEE